MLKTFWSYLSMFLSLSDRARAMSKEVVITNIFLTQLCYTINAQSELFRIFQALSIVLVPLTSRVCTLHIIWLMVSLQFSNFKFLICHVMSLLKNLPFFEWKRAKSWKYEQSKNLPSTFLGPMVLCIWSNFMSLA